MGAIVGAVALHQALTKTVVFGIVLAVAYGSAVPGLREAGETRARLDADRS